MSLLKDKGGHIEWVDATDLGENWLNEPHMR